jgi:hypothetical protein
VISQNTCALLPPGVYGSFQEVELAEANLQISFGGDSKPDYSKAGNMYVVNPNGTYSESNREQAIFIALVNKVIFVNGSINSVDAAISNATAIAAKTGRQVVLIYMAQTATPYPLNPDNANLKEKAVLRDLLDTLGDTKVGVIGHSWSGHIVLHETKYRSNVEVTLINPAQLPFGGVVNQFIDDIKWTRAPVTVMAGANDWLSKVGIGQQSEDTNVCGGKCQDLREADLSNPLVNQVMVPNAGHGMRSMIENGAQFMIPQ